MAIHHSFAALVVLVLTFASSSDVARASGGPSQFLAARRASTAGEEMVSANADTATADMRSLEDGATTTTEALLKGSAICQSEKVVSICADATKNLFKWDMDCQEEPCLTRKQVLSCCKDRVGQVVSDMPAIERVALGLGIAVVLFCLLSCLICACRSCCCCFQK